MDTVSAEHFLLDQFPLRLRSTIPTTLRAAYAAAALVIDAPPIEQTEFEAVLLLKEEINKRIRDHGE